MVLREVFVLLPYGVRTQILCVQKMFVGVILGIQILMEVALKVCIVNQSLFAYIYWFKAELMFSFFFFVDCTYRLVQFSLYSDANIQAQ